jgi:hypothetical protein
MGFGYGPKMSQYRVDPAAFPKGPTKEHIRYLGPDDKRAIVACYNRFTDHTHGMMYKTEREMRSLFRRQENQMVGVELDGELRGSSSIRSSTAMTLAPTTSTFRNGSMKRRMPCQSYRLPCIRRPTRSGGSSPTPKTRTYLLLDPRDGPGKLIPSVYHQSNCEGVGLMVRVIDVPGIFDLLREHSSAGHTCTLKLSIADSFLPENAGSTPLRLEGGRLQRLEASEHDVEVRLAIEDLSSLLASSVSFASLYRYNLGRGSKVSYVDSQTGSLLWSKSRFA